MSKSPVTNKPISGALVPRFAGVATFMRLPHVRLEDAGSIDIGLIGIPWDGGTTNRAGARHGPRQVREMSSLMRNVHPVTHVKPYELANCADLGDVDVQPIDPAEALARIEQFFRSVREQDIVPLSVGGDHLTTLPVLRAIADGRRLGLVHIDAHSDTNDVSFGRFKYTHGTPFRRAIEEGLIDPKRMIQIGIRGSLYAEDDFDWARQQGIRIVPIEEFDDLGFAEVAKLAHAVVGSGPAYLSFDIDALDPAFAPGHRHARSRRHEHIGSAAPRARAARHQFHRRGSGGSVAAVRSERQYRDRRGHAAVRNSVPSCRATADAHETYYHTNLGMI